MLIYLKIQFITITKIYVNIKKLLYIFGYLFINFLNMHDKHDNIIMFIIIDNIVVCFIIMLTMINKYDNKFKFQFFTKINKLFVTTSIIEMAI